MFDLVLVQAKFETVLTWTASGLWGGEGSLCRGCPLLFSGAEATWRAEGRLPGEKGLRSKVRAL